MSKGSCQGDQFSIRRRPAQPRKPSPQFTASRRRFTGSHSRPSQGHHGGYALFSPLPFACLKSKVGLRRWPTKKTYSMIRVPECHHSKRRVHVSLSHPNSMMALLISSNAGNTSINEGNAGSASHFQFPPSYLNNIHE